MSRRSLATSLTALALAVAACSKEPSDAPAAGPAADAVDMSSASRFADFRGDAAAGEAAFAQCKACHVVDPGANRMGPSLHAVVGRKAGSVAGFRYSPAMQSSGITWSARKMFEFLESPRRVVPGTTMGYGGMSDPQRRADIIAYLQANGT